MSTSAPATAQLGYLVRMTRGWVRGLLLKRRLSKAGSRLVATGRIRLTLRHGRIEFGDRVSLEAMKILVVGSSARTAVLAIGADTFINEWSELHVGERMTIGSGCAIAGGVIIRDRDTHRIGTELSGIPSSEATAPVTIGDHVWIGSRAMILKGVSIGPGAVIGAGSVVTHDVPAGCLAVGNPAKVERTGVVWEV